MTENIQFILSVGVPFALAVLLTRATLSWFIKPFIKPRSMNHNYDIIIHREIKVKLEKPTL